MKYRFLTENENLFDVKLPHGPAHSKLSLSVVADRIHVRNQMLMDAEAAGFHIIEVNRLDTMCNIDTQPLGDVMLLDCPEGNNQALDALIRINKRAAYTKTALIISTSVDALDDVYGCLNHSSSQILVNPSRAERLIALSQVIIRLSGRQVRELSERDRVVLLRLTEQVSQIAVQMEKFTGLEHHPAALLTKPSGSMFSFKPGSNSTVVSECSANSMTRTSRPALPNPLEVRSIIRQRQLRTSFFENGLFADPAWDILLDLTAACVENVNVSVSSLCIASSVPPTTALRWISQMTEAGLLQRNEDKNDRRRVFITMSEKTTDCMVRFFARVSGETRPII